MLRIIIICTITFTVITDGEGFGLPFRNSSHQKKFEKFFHKEEKTENENNSKHGKHSVCRTEECFRVAAELWESVNKSVDPCENFYEYACGRWSINNPIPPTEMTWDSQAKIEKRIKNRIRDLLEERIQPDDILPVKQLKKFYRSCMNVEALEKMGVKRLQAILIRNGGWPIAMELEEWDPEEFTWQKIDKYYLKLTGTSAFYNIKIEEDYRETDFISNFIDPEPEDVKMMLGLAAPNLPTVLTRMPTKTFNRTSLYETGYYSKLITEVALIFAKERGTIVDKEQLAADVQDMIDLEKKLENDFGSFQDASKTVSLEELQTIYDTVSHKSEASKVNWKVTIIDYFADANVEVSEDEDIHIWSLGHLKNMVKILEETKPRTIVNYIHWHFLTQYLSYTTTQMRKLQYDLEKGVAGIEEEPPRSEMCVRETGMQHAIAYQFVKKFFKKDMKEQAEHIFSGVQKAMIKHILKADWLDDKMRKTQLQKLNKMKRNIGFPNWYNNASVMENYYRGMVIGNQFFANVLSYQIFSHKKWLRSLRNKGSEDEWSFTDPIEVNAFYSSFMNTLTIPAGEFQTPFYSPTLPQIISYGSIGFTVGHEVSHSFDVDGIHFDENGKKIRFSYDARAEYKRRSNCFISQYENYYKDKSGNNDSTLSFWGLLHSIVKLFSWKKVDGERTQAENIADSMGLEIVFEALEEIENEKNSPRFPGFEDLTNEQFFFLSYANVWCENSTSKYEDLTRNYDSHSEHRYRVIAAVQNSEEFAKAFNCPTGSPMNPEEKCKIW